MEEDLGSSKSVTALLTGIQEALDQHTQLLTILNVTCRRVTHPRADRARRCLTSERSRASQPHR